MVVVSFDVLFAETFRGFHDLASASIFGGALTRATAVLALVGLLFFFDQTTLRVVVLLTIASGALILVLAVVLLSRKLRRLVGQPQQPVQSSVLLRNAWPLLISNFTIFLVGHADLWILGVFQSDREVAVYALAVRMVMLVGMPLTIANAVLPPVIGELHAQDRKERLQQLIRMTASLAAIPSLALLLILTLGGGPILAIAFGSQYRDGAAALALLSFGQFIGVFAGSCGYTLIMTGHQRDLMWISLAAGMVGVLGALATVRPLGATGVAGAVMFGTMVQQALMLITARRLCGIWTFASPQMALTGGTRLVRFLNKELRR